MVEAVGVEPVAKAIQRSTNFYCFQHIDFSAEVNRRRSSVDLGRGIDDGALHRKRAGRCRTRDSR